MSSILGTGLLLRHATALRCRTAGGSRRTAAGRGRERVDEASAALPPLGAEGLVARANAVGGKAGGREEKVRKAVHELERALGAGALAVQRHQVALCPPACRPRHMQRGASRRAVQVSREVRRGGGEMGRTKGL